jgi:sulfate transport system permease protein
MGLALTYLSLLVLAPIAVLFVRASSLPLADVARAVTTPRALAAFALSFGASAVAAAVNVVFGVVVAWVLVRYRFPGRDLVDALVDLPFALPTAVGGIALATVYARTGVLGRHLHAIGVTSAYSRLGVVIALVFVGLPFVVRTVQPVLAELDVEQEEVAATLGAGRLETLRRVVLPGLWPAALTGFALAFARGLGEFGSVVFISGNLPNKTEIAPMLILTKLEQFDVTGATALAAVMLAASFALLLVVNRIQARGARTGAAS